MRKPKKFVGGGFTDLLSFRRWGFTPRPPAVLPCFAKFWMHHCNEVFEILSMIIFVHHAGDTQTLSTPSASVLIWLLTNDDAP